MIRVEVVSLGESFLEAFSALHDVSARREVALNVMEGARSKLITIAGERLKSSRADYLQGIQPLEEEDGAVVLTLSGALALMVEHGWDARALHDTLLSDPSKVRVSAAGDRYRSIPFRHKTPGTTHQGGQPMGSQYGPSGHMSRAAPKTVVQDTAALGKAVHKAAKKLQKGQSLPAGLAPKLREKHSTDVFAGMRVRRQPVAKKGGGVGFHRTYQTFRTITDARPDKWHHPGVAARDFFGDVEEYVGKVAPAAVEAYLRSRFGGGS